MQFILKKHLIYKAVMRFCVPVYNVSTSTLVEYAVIVVYDNVVWRQYLCRRAVRTQCRVL